MIFLLIFFIITHQADVDVGIAFNSDYDSFNIYFQVIQQESNEGDICSVTADLSNNIICDSTKVAIKSDISFDESSSKIVCEPFAKVQVYKIQCSSLTTYSFFGSGFSGPLHEDEVVITFSIEIQNLNRDTKQYTLNKTYQKTFESMEELKIKVSDQTAFTLSTLNIQYNTKYTFTPKTYLEVEFPPQDPAQPSSQITHIDSTKLKCIGKKALTSQLDCTFSNNILKISQTTPIIQNTSYETVEFEIQGFLTKYIISIITLKVRTKISGDKEYIQYEGSQDIETVKPYSQQAQLISSSDNIGMNNEIQLIIKISSFFDGSGFLELQLDLDLASIY